MGDPGHAAHHPFGAEWLQHLKVQVPEALVPSPSFFIARSGKVEWLGHLSMEDVEVILHPVQHGEEPQSAIPNAEHSSFNLLAQTILI